MAESRGITLDIRIPAITNQQLETEHQLASWFLSVAEECRVLSSQFFAARPKEAPP